MDGTVALPPLQSGRGAREAAVLALLLGPLILVGMLAPFAGRGDDAVSWAPSTLSLADVTWWWWWAVPAAAAIIGGVAALRGHREGVAAAAGVGLVHLILAAGLLNEAWFDSSSTPHVGSIAFAVAMVVTVILIVHVLTGIGDRRGGVHVAVPPWVVVLGLAGAGLLAISMILPTVSTGSVADHLFAGDTWSDVTTLYLITAPPVAAILLMTRPTRAMVALLAGTATWYATSWWVAARGYGVGLTGVDNFPWATAGIGLLALCAVGGLGTRRTAALRAGSWSPHPLTWLAVGALTVALAVGISSHAAGDDGHLRGYTDGISDEGIALQYEDLPYDEALTPIASACDGGDMAACDSLYLASPSGSDFERFGSTCGGTTATLSGGHCAESYE